MKQILYFSCIEWNGMQQRSHFIAKELSDLGYHVTYLVVGTPKSRRIRVTSNLTVCEISSVRGYMRLSMIRAISRLIIAAVLNQKWFDTIILTNPVQIELLPKRIGQNPILYDCMDLMPEFYQGKKKELLERLEERLCNRAYHIFVTSEPLKDWLKEKYNISDRKITLLYNAVDIKDCTKAQRIDTLKHPALIYMGAVEWWVDFPLLLDFMKEEPTFHLYVVGDGDPKQRERLKVIQNCHFIGKVSHIEALSYVQSADVALLPFVSCPLIDMVDPIKLYEYLALGKPVVSLYWPALKHFLNEPLIEFYTRREEFSIAVKRAQGKKDEYKHKFDFMCENSWKARAIKMSDQIEKMISSHK